jgi:hypothetical protein
MYLIHQTSLTNLKKILHDGVLKPSCKTRNIRLGDDDHCLDEIYMSVVFPDMRITKQSRYGNVIIVFDIDTMKKYNVSHWSPDWYYGDIMDKSILYNKTKTPIENINLWNSNLNPIKNNRWRQEVIFKEDEIPLKDNLIGVFYDGSDDFKDKIPKLIPTLRQFNKFISPSSSLSHKTAGKRYTRNVTRRKLY